jgi:hypothetical protein
MNSCASGKPSLRVVLFLLFAALPLVACGGNVVVDHGGDTSGSGGAGGSSSSPSMYGTPTAACDINMGGLHVCEQAFDTKGGAAVSQACPGTGHSIPACPAAGLSGCCLLQSPGIGEVEECLYGGLPTSEFQKACQQQHGKFSTSP